MLSPERLVFGQNPPDRPDAARIRETDQLIDALANRKFAAPEIIQTAGGAASVPLFGEDYDPAEQARVIMALREVLAGEGEELWERLVEHCTDTRYALSYEHKGYANNLTVGDLCKEIAAGDLMAAYRQYAPRVPGLETEGQNNELWIPVALLSTLDDDDEKSEAQRLQEWRRKRQDKPLHELQIELCDWAITEAPALTKLSDGRREKFVNQVKREVVRLKETHKPVVIRQRFQGEGYAFYGEKRVKTIREKYGTKAQRSPKD